MKILIFSHKADNDGITPVILSKLTFEQVDYILEEPSTINESFQKEYEQGKFDEYDKIIVTDLCINHTLARTIENDEKNKNKVLIFDHHHSALDMNQYSFITVISEIKQKKQCATTIYYKYLLENYENDYLKKDVVKELVELVRLIDTWDFEKENKIEGKWLGDLFDIYGREYYLKNYYNFCKTEEHFYFTELEKQLLEIENKKIQNYIEKKEKEIIPVKIKEYNVGIVFAENYRSELGNALSKKYQDIYDFFCIINISKSVSYRGVKEIDLGEIAKTYGGGGHQKASGSPIPENLQTDVIKRLFKDVTIVEK